MADNQETQGDVAGEQSQTFVDIEISTPNGEVVVMKQVSVNEPVSAIKQPLMEFQETCYYTNYNLVAVGITAEDGSSFILSDFDEIANYVSGDVLSLAIEPKPYDINSARLQIKRVREIITVPPLLKGKPVSASAETEEVDDATQDLLMKAQTLYEELEGLQEVEDEARKPREQAIRSELLELREKLAKLKIDTKSIKELLPNLEAARDLPKLSEFYNELLFRNGSVDSVLTSSKPPSACVKSIIASGWNPAPSYRRLQGDLLYIEVTCDEGVLHITATAKGFYVNKSTRHNFDPNPAAVPAFSHELFETLSTACHGLRASWTALSNELDKATSDSKPLDVVASLFAQGQGDAAMVKPQWNYPPLNVFSVDQSKAHKHHTFDISRSQEDLADTFGVEEKGASREWNDEIQALRALPERNTQEKVVKARFEHKVLSEFRESCKLLAVAVSDGLIAPMNYTDKESSHIFFYNGIFMSRTNDSEERFKLFSGDEAHRKSANHDLNNQKVILASGIDGLSVVMCTLIDYKGDRYLGQTVIPGILSTGENSARLMYGALESGSRLTVKNSSLEILRNVAKSFYLAERNVPAIPVVKAEAEAPSNEEEKSEDKMVTGWNGILDAMEAETQTPVKVDSDDEAVPADSPSVPHIGPLEAKLLKGTDGRTYILELLRLTPRDANFVKGDKGTKHFSDEVLSKVDENIAAVYLLRPELIARYIQVTVGTKRRDVLIEAATAYKAKKQEASNGENKAEEEEMDEKEFLTQEITDKINAITADSLGLEINPNVFMNVVADVDPAVVAKDEETVRNLSLFLINQVVPAITNQIRSGEIVPQDNSSMVQLLHNSGINLRYLGVLAQQAWGQEQEDIMNALVGKQRIVSMPYYWLEFLETEIIARSCKQMMNKLMRENSNIKNAPATAIVAMLNAILGNGVVEVEAKVDTKATNAATTSNNKKKGKKGKKGHEQQHQQPEATIETFAYSFTRNEVLETLKSTIQEKFCHALLLNNDKRPESETVVETPEITDFLHTRFNKLAVLRRICQQVGLRVATKDYDFKTPQPFKVDDVIALVPKVKSCEPDVIFPEAQEMLAVARAHLEEKNYASAFDVAQEASNNIHMITGPIHKEALKSVDHLSDILFVGSDTATAIATNIKSLSVAVQLYGLDAQETLQYHMQLAVLYIDSRDYVRALHHVLSAKYLVECISSDRHPEMSNIYAQLATIAREIGEYDYAIRALMDARLRVTDLTKHCHFSEGIAEVMMLHGRIDEALREQRMVHSMIVDMFGEENARAKASKARLEKYLRAVTERNVSQAKEKQVQDAIQKEKEWTNSYRSFGNTRGAKSSTRAAISGVHKRSGLKSRR